MTLIKSISGIRGTIGGPTGDTLNPLDIVKFTTAYATFMKRNAKTEGRGKIVVGATHVSQATWCATSCAVLLWVWDLM